MNLAHNLRQLRLKAKLSQVELADKAGLSQQLVSQIETGKADKTTELPALARALGCFVWDLDEDYRPPADMQWWAEFMADRPGAEAAHMKTSMEVLWPKKADGDH